MFEWYHIGDARGRFADCEYLLFSDDDGKCDSRRVCSGFDQCKLTHHRGLRIGFSVVDLGEWDKRFK